MSEQNRGYGGGGFSERWIAEPFPIRLECSSLRGSGRPFLDANGNCQCGNCVRQFG